MTEEYIKGSGTGRGGWRGGGRPFKEDKKKMYSFRLSIEELKAVRELLIRIREGGNMTKYDKIMTYDIDTLAKWLKQFSDFDGDWRTLRLWLESDGNEGLL